MGTEPTPFRLEVEPNGWGSKLFLHGEDVTKVLQVHAVYLTVDARSGTRLVIETAALPGAAEGSALVETTTGESLPAETILSFLSNLDPDQVQLDMLARGGSFEEPEGVGQAFIQTLKDYVSGNSNGS